MKNDTIAAISTAVSESGIGIIRISGEEAFAVADRVYKAKGKKKKHSLRIQERRPMKMRLKLRRHSPNVPM